MRDLLEAGTVRSAIDRRYELERGSRTPCATSARSHARAKLVITM